MAIKKWRKSNFSNLTAADLAKFASENRETFQKQTDRMQESFRKRWVLVCKDMPMPFDDKNVYIGPAAKTPGEALAANANQSISDTDKANADRVKANEAQEQKWLEEEKKAADALKSEAGKYISKCKGLFTLPDASFLPGKATPVTKEVAKTKKFKHAVALGILVKK